jgi:hypothetical protein
VSPIRRVAQPLELPAPIRLLWLSERSLSSEYSRKAQEEYSRKAQESPKGRPGGGFASSKRPTYV